MPRRQIWGSGVGVGGSHQREMVGLLGEGVSSASLEVVNWRPIFQGVWGQGGWVIAAQWERILIDLSWVLLEADPSGRYPWLWDLSPLPSSELPGSPWQ